MLFRIGVCLVLCLLSWPSEVASQEDLASMCEAWNLCNKNLTEKFEALDSGDVTPGLADDYRDLVDEANDLIKSMRTQGLSELKANPGDGKVIRALLGIMVHDAQSGRDKMVLDVGQALIDARINPLYFEQAAKADSLEPSQKHVFDELAVRHKETMADDLPQVKLTTTSGEIVFELFENEAPNTVRNFVSLVESGYYSNKLFHRVIENFMAQGGGFETEGIGSGGPGYQIECECKAADARRNFSGTISMALNGDRNSRDTGGSQFFINFKYNESLDRKHTVFGRIISGADVLDKIERTEISVNDFERPIEQAKPDKIVSAEVVRKRDHSYRVRKKGVSVAEFEMKEKAEAEAKAKAAAEAEAKKKAEAKAKAEAEAKMKAEAEAEMKAKTEAEAEAEAEAEEKAKAEETKSDEPESKEDDDSEEVDEDKS